MGRWNNIQALRVRIKNLKKEVDMLERIVDELERTEG